MGFLDGPLRDSIFLGFKGKLKSGFVRRRTMPQSGALDDEGDPIGLEPADTPVEGFIDEYSRSEKARVGIPETDFKVCILGGSAPDLAPKRDDIGQLGGRWFQIRGPVAIDPAGALWVAQGFAIEAPL